MKRIVIITIMLTLCASMVAAQGITGKGVKAGLNIANITGKDVEDTDPKIGVIVGGFLEYSVNDMFAVQPELLFSMKGFKSESEYEEEYTDEFGYTSVYHEKYEGSRTLSYIELPVLAKVKIPMEGNVKPSIFIGPFLGINVSATYKNDWEFTYKVYDENDELVESTSDSGSDDGDLEDVASTEFGLIFGAGTNIGPVVIDARYNLGLTDIWDENEDDAVKNSVISILLGYSF